MASQCMSSALADAATGARQTPSLNRSIFSSHHRPTCRSKCHPPVLTCVRPGAATGALDFGRWEGECHPLTPRFLVVDCQVHIYTDPAPTAPSPMSMGDVRGKMQRLRVAASLLSPLPAPSHRRFLRMNGWGCACHFLNSKDTHWRADRSKYLCGCRSPVQYRPLG